MSSNPRITGVNTIINGRLGLCTVVKLRAKVRERTLGLRSRLNDGPVCDAQRR